MMILKEQIVFKNIDLNRAVANQLQGHLPVLTDLHPYGWKALNFDDLVNKVVPVIIVPSDKENPLLIREGVHNFKTLLRKVNQWFHAESGLKFDYIDPILNLSVRSCGEWNQLSHRTSDSQYRFDYYNKAVESIFTSVPKRSDVCYIVGVYTGYSGYGLGAADGHGTDLPPVLPPSTISYDYSNDYNQMGAEQKKLIWATAHELGHQFGLDHPGENSPLWGWSVMSNANLPYAKIREPELSILKSCRFLKSS